MSKDIKVGALSLGLTYAGSFFGAGFVSGNELFEFFGSFGMHGYLGIALAIVLFIVFGILLIRTVQLSNKTSFDEVIIIGNHPGLRLILGALTVFLMFGILVIMAAGTGALIYRVFDLPHFIGCAIFISAVCLAAMFGISGAVRVFSTLVPILVVMTLIICATALKKYGISFDIPVENENPLLINWWFSAITYVSYNMITLIGTMIPVGAHIRKKITVYSGIIFGCFLALSIASGILLAVTSMHESAGAELPMLDIAFRLNDFFGYIYAVLLLFAMFGTSLASLVAIIVYFEEKLPSATRSKKIVIYIIGMLGFICSLAGFGNLVNTVYPIFGYIGFAVLLCIMGNFIYLKIKK